MYGLKRAVSIDFDYRRGYVYWSDISEGTISRVSINGSSRQTVIRGIGLMTVMMTVVLIVFTYGWRCSLDIKSHLNKSIKTNHFDGSGNGGVNAGTEERFFNLGSRGV